MLVPLTVIIPTYNRPDSTHRAIESLKRQQIEPVEVIVVDDGSSPPFVLNNNWPFHISLLRHPQNRGPAAARNTGLAAASTDWIAFLDSDDYLLPDTLHLRLTDAESAGPSVFHACAWLEIDTRTGRPLGRIEPQDSLSSNDHFAGIWFAPGTCLIANRKHVRSIGVDFDETLRRLEDYDWICRLVEGGMILRTSSIVGAAISRERLVNPAVVDAAAMMILKKWQARGIYGRRQRAMQSYMAFERASAHYFAGNHGQFLALMARSFIFKPRLGLHPLPKMRKRQIVSDVGTLG